MASTSSTTNTVILEAIDYDVKLGNKIAHSFSMNSGTGYDWYIKSINKETYEKTQTVVNQMVNITSGLHVTQSRPGSKTTRLFTTETFAEGVFAIVFEFKRIWEPVSVKEQTITITVTK